MLSLLEHISPLVRKLKSYQHGSSISEIAAEHGITDIIKMSSNENPLGAGKCALQALQKLERKSLSRYPDAGGVILRQTLSQKLGVGSDCILLGNGSNEILELGAKLLLCNGNSSVYSQYAFVVYGIATASCRATARVIAAKDYAHDLENMAVAANKEGSRLVFIANPNNPTGTWHTPTRLRDFMKAVPDDVLVVIDEAYCEYLPETEKTCFSLLKQFNNLLITRTFSKIHGLANLRVGYSIGNPDLIEMLNRIRQPFNINGIAQQIAAAALEDDEHIQKSRTLNAAGMCQLQEGLTKYGYRWLPSWGNFLSFSGGKKTAAAYESLLAAGVIVRPLDSYGLNQWLRVTVGKEEENLRFLKVLAGG